MEIYVSVDIETDGRFPGTANMLSLGMVALHGETLETIDQFSANLSRLPDLRPDSETMNWWDGFPDAWRQSRKDPRDPETVIKEAERWVGALRDKYAVGGERAKAVFAAAPVGFDFSFYIYYVGRFVGASEFGHRALDMRSYAMGAVDQPYHSDTGAWVLDEWKTGAPPHTHVAIEDAHEQAVLLRNMIAWRRERALTSHVQVVIP